MSSDAPITVCFPCCEPGLDGLYSSTLYTYCIDDYSTGWTAHIISSTHSFWGACSNYIYCCRWIPSQLEYQTIQLLMYKCIQSSWQLPHGWCTIRRWPANQHTLLRDIGEREQRSFSLTENCNRSLRASLHPPTAY